MIISATEEREDLGGGQYRLRLHGAPIAYGPPGGLRRLSNQLGDAGDPSWGHACDELLRVRLARASSPAFPIAWIEHGGTYAAWTLLGAEVRDSWRAANQVEYRGVLPDTALRYTLAGHVVKMAAEMGPAHPPVVRWALRSNNYDPATGRIGAMRLHPFTWTPAGADEATELLHSVVWERGRWVLTVAVPDGPGVLDPTTSIAASTDTYMLNYSADSNYGTSEELRLTSASRRSLLKPDLSSIPAGATINSANLTLTWIRVAAASGNLGVYRILAKPWTEAGATWNKYDGSNAWATAGCLGEGTDYTTTGYAYTAFTLTTESGGSTTAINAKDIVSAWMGGATNNGVLLVETSGLNLGVASSEHATSSYRWTWECTYTEAASGGKPWYYYAQM